MTPDALEELPSSRQEVALLFERYTVALADAGVAGQSSDGRYVDAYTAGFLLAKIAVRASGYRVKGGENHRDTILALRWVLGSIAEHFSRVMEDARRQRNQGLYDRVGIADDDDVDDLLDQVRRFEAVLLAWLAEHHPELHALGRL